MQGGAPRSGDMQAAACGDSGAALERQRFDGLLQRLEQLRAQLHAWGQAMPRWQQRYHEQAVPLFERLAALEVERVLQLDRAHDLFRPGKADARFLSELIGELAASLAAQGHAGMEAVLQRHPAAGPQAQADDGMDPALRQALADELGLDPAELDAIELPEALVARVRERERMRGEHARRRQAPRQAGRVAKAALADEPPLPARELFRRLASVLHPDREPDPAERERKTALMQRANTAYRAGNLYALIELQLEVGQLRPEQLRLMDAQRIGRYSQDLERQLVEGMAELDRVQADFRAGYGIDEGVRLDPARLDSLLARLKRQLGAGIAWLEEELRQVQDPERFRHWLKAQRRQGPL